MYSVEDRNQLFSANHRQIMALVSRIEGGKTVGLDHRLLNDLLNAGLKCPGFNERQKFALVMASKVTNQQSRLSLTAHYWPFDTLNMKPNTSNGKMIVRCLSIFSLLSHLLTYTFPFKALRQLDRQGYSLQGSRHLHAPQLVQAEHAGQFSLWRCLVGVGFQ